MIIWALFDSGNGSYYKVGKKQGHEIYSMGLDIENKNNHFINLDLAQYNLFGECEITSQLNKLPKPDLIIASPPCESWSIASSMKDGNACWKTDTIENLFGTMKGSTFTVRDYIDYEKYQYYPEKQLIRRINGELCIFNTIQIIKKYQPKYWVIENPAYGKLWEYIEKILGFNIPYENLTYYNNYDYPVSKATRFSSNIFLDLKKEKKKQNVEWGNWTRSYNERSNIPQKLVEDIFNQIEEAKP